jgi:CheY-like chemotaxis protein
MHIRNLLVLDDDPVYNYVIAEFLDQIDTLDHYHIGSKGKEALSYLEFAAERNLFPDLILVDLQMPEMSGFEFIKEYEVKFCDKFPQTKLIVISSSKLEEDKTRVLACPSVLRFIPKPISQKKLEEILLVR